MSCIGLCVRVALLGRLCLAGCVWEMGSEVFGLQRGAGARITIRWTLYHNTPVLGLGICKPAGTA